MSTKEKYNIYSRFKSFQYLSKLLNIIQYKTTNEKNH